MSIKNKYQNILKTLCLIFAFSILSLAPVSAISVTSGPCTSSSSAPCKAGGSDIATIIGSVISLLLFVAGMIAVLVIVVGGIRYITSDGDPGAAGKAKNTVIYALVGLVIAISSYAIVNFVVGRI